MLEGDKIKITVSENKIEAKVKSLYITGVYFSEEYLKAIEVLFNTIAKVFEIETNEIYFERGSYILGETDGVKIKRKGLEFNTKYIDEIDFAQAYFLESSFTPRGTNKISKQLKSFDSKKELYNPKKQNYRIYTNPQLAFLRAYVVYCKLRQTKVNVSGIEIVAKPHQEIGIANDKQRKVTCYFVIKIPNMKKIPKKEFNLLKRDLRPLLSQF